MTTIYLLPNGQQTTDYQAFRDARADYAAAQAKFDARFGALLSTPEGRRAAVAVMRAGSLEKSRIVQVAPAAPKFKGGLSEAEVERRVAVASTGVTNRHGAEVFAVPSASNAPAVEVLPPGMTRIPFFSGLPQG